MRDVHVRQRKNAKGEFTSWEYRFEIAPVNGERKYQTKASFRTKGEAKKAGREALLRYENIGEAVIPSEMSFADFLDYWMENDCKLDLKPSTIRGYEKIIRLYIKPVLGAYRLKSIKKDDLQRLIIEKYKQGFSYNTLSSVKGLLTKSMGYAVDNHYLVISPAHRLKIPKTMETDVPTRCDPHVYIPQNRIAEIFERFPVGTPNHVQLMLGYKCGLRLGEAFGLCWEDIDLENKTIFIHRQVQWQQDKSRTAEEKKTKNGSVDCGNGYWYFADPKYKSVRKIEIDDALVELLRNEKQEQERAKEFYGSKYIYYYEDERQRISTTPSNKPVNFVAVRKAEVLSGQAQMPGSFISPRTMQYTSSVIHHKLNYAEFDFHSLRHTHATMLAENGAPPKYVQKRLGHAKIDVTLNIYQHLTASLREQGAAVLNEMFT